MPTWIAGAQLRLGDLAPVWFAALAEDLTDRCAPGVAAEHLRKVERVLHDGHREPAAVVDKLRVDGRSPGATARLVDEFFVRAGIGGCLDEQNRRAQGRRQRRLTRVPAPMRPAVEAFAGHLLDSRRRAALVGHGVLSDVTVDARLADLATLARELAECGITDWSMVSTGDLEAFVSTNTGSRLASCRAFFAFARRRKLILIDPTRALTRKQPRGFSGPVVSLDQQRQLLRRWVRLDLDPRERLVGLLSLIHGASCAELRHLRVLDVDPHAATLILGRRPHPVPLDPLTAAALRDTLAARTASKTSNPHVLITKDSRLHDTPCSPYFMTHVLDGAGLTPARLRQTRLSDLAQRVDPSLVAAAFGMTEEGAMHYVHDSVHDEEHAFSSHL